MVFATPKGLNVNSPRWNLEFQKKASTVVGGFECFNKHQIGQAIFIYFIPPQVPPGAIHIQPLRGCLTPFSRTLKTQNQHETKFSVAKNTR